MSSSPVSVPLYRYESGQVWARVLGVSQLAVISDSIMGHPYLFDSEFRDRPVFVGFKRDSAGSNVPKTPELILIWTGRRLALYPHGGRSLPDISSFVAWGFLPFIRVNFSAKYPPMPVSRIAEIGARGSGRPGIPLVDISSWRMLGVDAPITYSNQAFLEWLNVSNEKP